MEQITEQKQQNANDIATPVSSVAAGAADAVLSVDKTISKDFAQKHQEELSPVRYARKKVVELAITIGSLLGGGLVGYNIAERKPEWILGVKAHGLHRTLYRKFENFKNSDTMDFSEVQQFLHQNKLDALIEEAKRTLPEKSAIKKILIEQHRVAPSATLTQWSMGGGMILGGLVSGSVLAYGHWVKQESTKLSVQEINQDIANVKLRTRGTEELAKENMRLRAMLREEEAKTEALRMHTPDAVIAAAHAQQKGRMHEASQESISPTARG